MSVREMSIRLEGLELSDKDIASLERDINALVLKHVGSTKQKGAVGYATGQAAISLGKLNPQWRGIWLRDFVNKAELEKQKVFTPAQTIATGH